MEEGHIVIIILCVLLITLAFAYGNKYINKRIVKLGGIIKDDKIYWNNRDGEDNMDSNTVSTPISMEEMENKTVSTLIEEENARNSWLPAISQSSLSSSSERDPLDDINPLETFDQRKRGRRGRIDGRRINPKKRKKLRRKEVDKTRAIEF